MLPDPPMDASSSVGRAATGTLAAAGPARTCIVCDQAHAACPTDCGTIIPIPVGTKRK